MKAIIPILILAGMLFSACVADNPPQIIGLPQTRSQPQSHGISRANIQDGAKTEAPLPISIPVLQYLPQAPRGVHEATNGTYLAAWLCPNSTNRDFIAQSKRDHSAFVHELPLDGQVPTSWILQCMAVMATPIFIVTPPIAPCQYTPIGETIAVLAQELGAFNIPMFVAFYPQWHPHGLSTANYTILFRYARAIFLQYAPQVAFVWVAPSLESTMGNPFFPGTEAVDWVGVSLFASRNAYGFTTDALKAFAPFYHNFQGHFPIMILPLGVSHFTRDNHSYDIPAAAMEIERIYNGLAGFPRVGLVAYGDAFGIRRSTREDFSISIDTRLMDAYTNATSNDVFLATLETNAPHASRWARTVFSGYYLDGTAYIKTTALAEMGIPIPRSTWDINGDVVANLQDVQGGRLEFCHVRKIIFLQ